MNKIAIAQRYDDGLLVQLLDQLDAFGKEKTQYARECCQAYERNCKEFKNSSRQDVTSFSVKFFTDLK